MRAGPALALTAAVGAAWPFLEPLFPALRRVSVPVLGPSATELRVLHVSDLHLLPGSTRRSAWVRELAGLRPNLVVSTGDHLASGDSIDLLADTLGALTADGTPGVFVPGNNDYYAPRAPSLRRYVSGGAPRRRGPDLPWGEAADALVERGWTDLTHRRAALRLRGLDLTLSGTDDAHLRRDRYAEVAGPVAGDLGIGVTHTPAARVLDGFVRDGHRLLLAGHTHGGQVRVPGVGALVTNCDLERGRARGLSGYGPAWLHVSAGLGTSPYAPIRFACRPEATLLTLTPGNR